VQFGCFCTCEWPPRTRHNIIWYICFTEMSLFPIKASKGKDRFKKQISYRIERHIRELVAYKVNIHHRLVRRTRCLEHIMCEQKFKC
jgi:hypothetical protein